MPTNPAIPTLATGNFLSATQWNYLTALNTGIGLYGVSGTLVGSAPAVTAPNALIQTGYVVPTFSAGLGSFSLGTAFPNSLLSIVFTGFVGAGGAVSATLGTGTSRSSIFLYVALNGAAYTGSTVGITYIAIGF